MFKVLCFAGFTTMVLGISMTDCGYESIDNKLTGQVKKVHHNTPIICSEYYSADVSLGVMRNGVGSMSTQDVEVVVSGAQLADFERAAEASALVEIGYKVKRVAFCTPDHIVDNVTVLK